MKVEQTYSQEMISKYGTLALRFVEKNMQLIEENKFNELFYKNNNNLITGNIISILDDSRIDWVSHVSSIPASAYWGNENITEFIIPDNIKGIGTDAFNNATNLNKLVLPATITDIGTDVFKNAYNLYEIQFKGTKKQWANIWFASHWNRESRIGKVICSDGIVMEALNK